MTATRPRLIGLGAAALVFAADQAVKAAMLGPLALEARGAIEIVPIFRFSWVENFGTSLGLFTAQSDAQRWLLVALTGAIALAVLAWLLREQRGRDTLPLGMVLGGALGNIVDRVRFGHVIDYADLHFGEWRPFLVFNLADAAITLGVLIILAHSFLSREKRPHDAAPPAPETSHNA